MIDPTDEMADAFRRAEVAYWEAREATAEGMTVAEHGRAAYRAGLAAVFELVERDYHVLPRGRTLTTCCYSCGCSKTEADIRAAGEPCCEFDRFQPAGRDGDCLCGADLGPPWDSVPHRRGTPGCRLAEAPS